MKHFNIGMGVFAATLLVSSLAHSQMTEEEFQALLESQNSAGYSQEESSQNGEGEEVVIETLAIPDLYLDIDNHQARLRRLEQMLAIAELEQQYLSLTGTVPEGAVTLTGINRAAGGGADSEAREIENALRDEITNLKRQVDAMALRLSNQEVESREVERAEVKAAQRPLVADSWKVNGISIFGDTRSAVITGGNGSSFSVRPGDNVGEVRVVSIESNAVRVRERGQPVDLPLAGESYLSEGEVVFLDNELTNGGREDRGGFDYNEGFISYEPVLDSTSR